MFFSQFTVHGLAKLIRTSITVNWKVNNSFLFEGFSNFEHKVAYRLDFFISALDNIYIYSDGTLNH